MNYKILEVANLDLKQWRKCFDDCPRDKYVSQGFRYKKISWLTASNGSFRQMPHRPMLQSKAYNPVHGDLVRDYPPIEDELIFRKDFQSSLEVFSINCNLGGSEVLLVQLQRIDCSSEYIGQPAVEGFHRDGVNWLGLLVVSRENILGGETLLKDGSGNVFFKKTIMPGEFLILDDRQMFHFTTSIQIESSLPSWGYRDVLIVTACARHQMA